MRKALQESLNTATRTLQAFTSNPENIDTIEAIAKQIALAFSKKAKVVIFGNGGSMCDAMHFAEELSGRYRNDRPALPAIAISDPSYLTCVANDYGFEEVFARGVEAFCLPDDIVIGISTSGNSPNVIRALDRAQKLGCITIALLGNDGGKLKGCCDFEIIVPAETSDRIQEIHTLALHSIVQGIELILFTAPNPIYT